MSNAVENGNRVTFGFGNPDVDSYEVVFDYLGLTDINTIRTSSIPLAQYWKNYDKRIREIETFLSLKLEHPKILFEYATASSGNSNSSSMTDIMILSENDIRVAIEAKYMELIDGHYESIDNWLQKSMGNSKNKENVLLHWTRKIQPYSDSNLSDIGDVPYQFFHRLASACNRSPKTAGMLYQIFYDEETKSSLQGTLELLEKAKAKIQPKGNLKITFQPIPCELKKTVDTNTLSDIFHRLKRENFYRFLND